MTTFRDGNPEPIQTRPSMGLHISNHRRRSMGQSMTTDRESVLIRQFQLAESIMELNDIALELLNDYGYGLARLRRMAPAHLDWKGEAFFWDDE